MTAHQWFSVAVVEEGSTTKMQEKTFEDEGPASYVGFSGGYTLTKNSSNYTLKMNEFY